MRLASCSWVVGFLCGCASEPRHPPAARLPIQRSQVVEAQTHSVPPPASTSRPEDGAAPEQVLMELTGPFLKGQLHAHTGRSYDAIAPPEEVVAFYRDRGYDFLAITDHNHITIPDPVEGMLLIPGVELTYNAFDCLPPPKPGYSCVYHMGVVFLNPMRDAALGRHFSVPYRRHRSEVQTWEMNRARDLDGVPILAHPSYHDAIDDAAVAELCHQGLSLMEVANAAADHRHSGEAPVARERTERLWDTALTKGFRLYGVAADDAHHFSDADEHVRHGHVAARGDQAWVMVAASKEVATIRAAILEGAFYATTGVELKKIRVTSRSFRVEIEPEQGHQHVTRFVGPGGTVLERIRGDDVACPISGNQAYVRAVVERDDGASAWVQPWLFDTEEEGGP